MNDSFEFVRWDDVQDAASKMFSVWVGGGELEWAKECWKHFQKAGLTSDSSSIELTSTYLRLVTLARIYEEFCGLAWEEDPETPLDYLAEGLEIDEVALGILAANADDRILEEYGDDYELKEAALITVTNAKRKEIYECLCAAYGGYVELYSRMFHTRKDSDSDGDGDRDEFEVTGTNARALQFVMDGFPA